MVDFRLHHLISNYNQSPALPLTCQWTHDFSLKQLARMQSYQYCPLTRAPRPRWLSGSEALQPACFVLHVHVVARTGHGSSEQTPQARSAHKQPEVLNISSASGCALDASQACALHGAVRIFEDLMQAAAPMHM